MVFGLCGPPVTNRAVEEFPSVQGLVIVQPQLLAARIALTWGLGRKPSNVTCNLAKVFNPANICDYFNILRES